MIEIGTYSTCDKESVIALVLHCQNDGTRPLVGVEDQSDLLHIEEEYIYDGGNFWVYRELSLKNHVVSQTPKTHRTTAVRGYAVSPYTVRTQRIFSIYISRFPYSSNR